MPYTYSLLGSRDSSFKLYHELMARKVQNILLVSTPYDAWIMEEDGRLSERIVNEYRGLNLILPPRLTWVATAADALRALQQKTFDLVITMPLVGDIDAHMLGQQIKIEEPDLPIILLTQSDWTDPKLMASVRPPGIDKILVWSGDTDLLVALVKSVEDQWNSAQDTELAGIRIILFVENSPLYTSILLPILYKALVQQTSAVLEDKLNEEHRMLTMRARPKILVAETYEQAMRLFTEFEPYILGVISDMQFPREHVLDDNAGLDFLTDIKQKRFDIALALTSADPANAVKADLIPAAFIDKTSPTLRSKIHEFFQYSLAFGDFIFRTSDDSEIVDRASDIREMEFCLRRLPEAALLYHVRRNDFSRWFFTRAESVLAAQIRDITTSDFADIEAMRRHLISVIHVHREDRQRGIIVDFGAAEFDIATEFFKIGQGSLGGKARGLAFVASLLKNSNESLAGHYQDIDILVPQTLVITTEGFDSFVQNNDLSHLASVDVEDKDVAERCLTSTFPQSIKKDLRTYLQHVHCPLAVRSSSLLEDAQFRAYAGLYHTYMLPNNHTNIKVRLAQLIHAIKLVYASTYFKGPKAFSQRVGRRTEDEQMGVIVQKLIGEHYGRFFYPAISGVAQSYNYYPFSRMKPEDGIATIALGLGRSVVEGEKTLRFSPKHPQLLPQRASVDTLLENAQRYFYALNMNQGESMPSISDLENLTKREVTDVADELPMQYLASTYIPAEHRIRDTTQIPGPRVLTFANVLKYKQFPLTDMLVEAMAMGQMGMGNPIELEFSVNFPQDNRRPPCFAFLQLRPMTARAESGIVEISTSDISTSFCYSTHALGNVHRRDMADIVFVKPDTFDTSKTREIARQIGTVNARLITEKRPYLLIGPGRWGTADPWIGIPVTWADISNVGAIVETTHRSLNAESSQGSHFFHNLMTSGINYITMTESDKLDWSWLTGLLPVSRQSYVAHIRLDTPFLWKVDGRSSRCVGIAQHGAQAD